MYKNAEQTLLILILYQDGKRKRSKWLWKSVQCWGMDGKSKWGMARARSMGKTLGNCGGQRTFDERDACALLQYVRKQKSNSSSGDWECQYRTRSDCQQEQSVDSYIVQFSGAKTIALVYKDVEKSHMVRWIILHHILDKWVSACVAYTKRTVQAWMLDPYNEGIRWLCYAVGGILLAWFGSTCPLRGKGHCRSIQSCSEWSPLSCDETFLSWWEWSLPGWQCPHPQGTRAHWMLWWGWKWCESYAMAFSHQISTQLNTYGRFWSDMLDGALHHHHQNTKWGNIFWKNAVHLSSRVQRLGESMPRRTEAVLAACGGPTPYQDT